MTGNRRPTQAELDELALRAVSDDKDGLFCPDCATRLLFLYTRHYQCPRCGGKWHLPMRQNR